MAVQPFAGVVGGYLTETDGFDGAVRVGCGFNFGRLYANVGYDFGLTIGDVHEGYFGEKWHNNTLFATIGFNLAGTR